jgi:integrase
LNDYIKIVCEKVGINEDVEGSKTTEIKKKVWRKIKGIYKKHELVSTHICRRSFATNHYGKLPTPVIMAVTGHTTEKMFLNYIGKTAKDNAETLSKFWQHQEFKQEQKPKLEIIKTGTN